MFIKKLVVGWALIGAAVLFAVLTSARRLTYWLKFRVTELLSRLPLPREYSLRRNRELNE
jgi:hypothetical protein